MPYLLAGFGMALNRILARSMYGGAGAYLASKGRNVTARANRSLPDSLNPTPVADALILRYQWDIHFERASDNKAVGRVAGEGAAQPRRSNSGGRGKRK